MRQVGLYPWVKKVGCIHRSGGLAGIQEARLAGIQVGYFEKN